MKKLSCLIVFTLLAYLTVYLVSAYAPPELGAVAVRQLNGGDAEVLQTYSAGILMNNLGLMVTLIVTCVWLVSMRKEMKKMLFVVALGVVIIGTGCRRPYDAPTFVEVGPDETAFVIQAEGNTENQDTFKSAELLEKSMVAAKRIQVPHRWVQTGRRLAAGHYIDSVLIYKVNRAPVTRTWGEKGGLEAESRDSLAVASGFTLTAYITPDDAAKFLFRYKGVPLAQVVDSQVRNSIQTVYTEECAKYALLDLPKHKQEITDTIRAKVIPFYKDWGITIAHDMGLVGGLNYDPAIQAEIDNVFKSQKAKERAAADRSAQAEINGKNKEIAETDAAIQKIKADADAYMITAKAKAIKEAGQIYVQAQFIDKWDGVMPKVSGNASPMLLLSEPELK